MLKDSKAVLARHHLIHPLFTWQIQPLTCIDRITPEPLKAQVTETEKPISRELAGIRMAVDGTSGISPVMKGSYNAPPPCSSPCGPSSGSRACIGAKPSSSGAKSVRREMLMNEFWKSRFASDEAVKK